MATQSTSSQQIPWGKIVLVIIVIVVVISWFAHVGPFHRNYTMTANFSGAQIQLTPITPPKALSTFPSDYVQVVVKVGTLTFSTDDPQYKCLESLIPLFFKEEILFPNVIGVAFENCGQIVHTEHEPLASLSSLLPNSGGLYAMFTIPDNNSTLCSSSSSQCIDFEPAKPTPTTPPSIPTPAPTQGPTFSNIMLYVNGKYYTAQSPFLQVKVGTPLVLHATWDGGALDGTGWYVVINGDAPNLIMCNTGTSCDFTETLQSPTIPNRIYDAELHDPSGNWTPSNIAYVDWVS
jgi:hypothetical protein